MYTENRLSPIQTLKLINKNCTHIKTASIKEEQMSDLKYDGMLLRLLFSMCEFSSKSGFLSMVFKHKDTHVKH